MRKLCYLSNRKKISKYLENFYYLQDFDASKSKCMQYNLAITQRQSMDIQVVRRLPEPSNSKIWSWVPQDSELKITVLTRTSRNLLRRTAATKGPQNLQWAGRCDRAEIYSWWGYSATNSPYTDRLTPPLLNTYMSRREQKILSRDLDKTWSQEWLCWREQQKINWQTDRMTMEFSFVIWVFKSVKLYCKQVQYVPDMASLYTLPHWSLCSFIQYTNTYIVA
jgi:hypothetical protein